ncbi:putative periplasmic solute-binding protein [Burkholderia aenigmatica]|uniref:Putative periplasmic solute-binding protein n=3 Tax=Burkholderia TaxID=32008 RepID=A0A6J5IMK8_9BURK|nr:ABC transporter substrate-binding protein [Burkholderia aenigmatica]CAB3961504.1 putative periplasmic solute-binding protein [Burkholderia aenigmatica]
MTERFSRRAFLGGSAAFGGSLLLGGTLLAGCDSRRHDAAQAASADAPRTPQRGGRLRLGILDGNLAGNLDAHKPVGGGVVRGFALYSKLWEWDANLTPTLALAEEAEVNADATAWTIRLKPGLEFHHGKTISADDVIFSIRRLTDPQLASPFAGLVAAVDRDRLEKLDARTVRIRFRAGRSFLSLPETWVNFGGIVPTDYHPVTNPVGAGPYRYKAFEPGRRSLFTRFENYFKPGRPYADELEIVSFQDETARIAALEAGQIDLANQIAPEQAVRLRANRRVQVLVSQTTGWQSFDMNTSRAPFDDVRVRQAFRLLADRDELVRRALNGQGRVANDLYGLDDPTFNHGIAPRPHDVAQARRLLKAAGRENLSVELVTGPSTLGGNPVGASLVFAEQAKQAGVDVRVKQLDAATFYGPQRDDWLFSNGGGFGGNFLPSGLSADAPASVSNKTHFRNARFGELFEAAMAQPDVDKRRPLVHEAQQIQYDEGGLLIWAYTNYQDAVAARVGGATAEKTLFTTWRFDSLWLDGAGPSSGAA